MSDRPNAPEAPTAPDINKLPGLKERDLAKLGPCCICKQPLLHKSSLTFYVVKVQHAALLVKNIQRQAGLAVMLGSPGLASVMGADADFAKIVSDKIVIIHERCAGEIGHIGALLEGGGE